MRSKGIGMHVGVSSDGNYSERDDFTSNKQISSPEEFRIRRGLNDRREGL